MLCFGKVTIWFLETFMVLNSKIIYTGRYGGDETFTFKDVRYKKAGNNLFRDNYW